ncbi:hypothetical protein F5Y16DRAFT_423758 [Xylariaceae sp. FL0255]|nr:hypothetical protein F5Y16DRAFT_423758 [Xylariaceae sp. FL0255]
MFANVTIRSHHPYTTFPGFRCARPASSGVTIVIDDERSQHGRGQASITLVPIDLQSHQRVSTITAVPSNLTPSTIPVSSFALVSGFRDYQQQPLTTPTARVGGVDHPVLLYNPSVLRNPYQLRENQYARPRESSGTLSPNNTVEETGPQTVVQNNVYTYAIGDRPLNELPRHRAQYRVPADLLAREREREAARVTGAEEIGHYWLSDQRAPMIRRSGLEVDREDPAYDGQMGYYSVPCNHGFVRGPMEAAPRGHAAGYAFGPCPCVLPRQRACGRAAPLRQNEEGTARALRAQTGTVVTESSHMSSSLSSSSSSSTIPSPPTYATDSHGNVQNARRDRQDDDEPLSPNIARCWMPRGGQGARRDTSFSNTRASDSVEG